MRKLHQTYYLPSMTPIVTVLFEDDEASRPAVPGPEYLQEVNRQLEGTYPFTLDRSVKAFRLNRFLHSLIQPQRRKQFLEDAEPLFEEAGLTEEERDLVRRRDWIGMIHYGVIFFMLEKLGAVTGIGNIDIYAAMKGMSVPEFQKTRNAQINYGVAGKED